MTPGMLRLRLNPFRVQVYDFVQRLDKKTTEDRARRALYSRDRLYPETRKQTLGSDRLNIAWLSSFQFELCLEILAQNTSYRRALRFGEEGGAQVRCCDRVGFIQDESLAGIEPTSREAEREGEREREEAERRRYHYANR
jgi:hypothetical protein